MINTWASEESIVRLRVVVHLAVEVFRYDGEAGGCWNFCNIRNNNNNRIQFSSPIFIALLSLVFMVLSY